MQSIGAPINTLENSEFAPTISADGKTLIFESNRGGRWMLFSSTLIRPGEWSKPVPLDAINDLIGPNNFLGGPFLSYDGNTLFFTSDMKGGVGGIDIWYSKKEKGKWGAPQNLGKPINTGGYEGFPSLSPDGRKLYFMKPAGRIGPSGQHCCVIYVAERRGRFFVNPQPLPFPINTGCEAYPRIMADGKTLIFSSARVGGKGGYDLYQSRLENGKWTMPVALDYINTPKDDELVTIPGSGDVIYFSSTTSNNIENIYFIDVPSDMRPDQVVAFEGSVRDEANNKPIEATIKMTNVRDKEDVIETDNDPETGDFQVFLKEGEKYDMSVSAKGYSFESKMVDLKDSKYRSMKHDIKLKPLKLNTSFTLNNIFFDFDSASLNPTSYMELDRVLELLNLNPGMVVEISAHTDDRGSDAYNDRLSQGRAESVVNYLTGKGVTESRLVAKGYGKRKPSVANTTEENRAKNRRVEFKVIKM
ncbi:MAG: OmpA family protein [Cytophagaceae bacterium]